MKKKEPSALSRLLSYAGSFRKLTYQSLLLSGLSSILSLMPFVYLWKIIKEVLEVQPDFSKATGIVHNGWMAVLFAVLSWLVYIAALACSHGGAFRTASNMKKALMEHIARLPVGFADEMGSGRVRRTVTDVTSSTETLLAHNLPDMASAVVLPVSMVVMLFLYDWRYGIACLIPVLLGFAAMMKMAGPAMKEDICLYQNSLERMSNEAVEYVRGVPVVKTFGQTVFSFHRFKASIDDYRDFCMHYTKTMRRPMLAYIVLINSAFAFILCLTLFLIRGENYQTDILLNFLFYLIFTPAIATSMNKVMFMGENNVKAADAVSRMDHILHLSPLPEPEHPQEPEDSSVELRDVTFRYSPDAEPAVSHLSLKADRDEIIALVGPSGSGKTTVAGLISRFFDPQDGQVLIGDTDVKEISKETLMKHVAYVFQDSRLLKRSIADNLRIAKPDATDQELMEALRKAQCSDIIERLPDGIHTVLGSRGTYLSGGEQQRIAIARTMLKGADVVILDEASAFADPECEAQVQRAFQEMARGRTVIMIAHRLSTIRNADRVYVLQDGRVAEEGKHDALLKQNGLYASMWEEHKRTVNWKVGETA
ncbi:MAG: ABC transporter ATP-binding protein/permease [Clostridiales bacterium]|nr:ABC transporter ATP-binding protein/permease [Clostridiales bacterium]